jgi:23S rRNA (adenine2503-C2)-methyltransferase
MVFMGMGEPLANLGAVVKAIRIFTDPRLGFGFSPRRITVSTVGLVAGIDKLGAEKLGVNLAISLHAATTSPVSPHAGQSLGASASWPRSGYRWRAPANFSTCSGRRQRRPGRRRTSRASCAGSGKVNLIPFNDWEGSAYRRPRLPRILAFQRGLLQAGVTTTVRWSKGEDIGAACGQLRGAVPA